MACAASCRAATLLPSCSTASSRDMPASRLANPRLTGASQALTAPAAGGGGAGHRTGTTTGPGAGRAPGRTTDTGVAGRVDGRDGIGVAGAVSPGPPVVRGSAGVPARSRGPVAGQPLEHSSGQLGAG